MSRSEKILVVVVTATGALILAVFVTGVFFVHEPSHIVLNHHRAVRTINSVNVAQANYARLHANKGFACSFADLGEKDSKSYEAMLARALAGDSLSDYHGRWSGYYFELSCTQAGNSSAATYAITGVPFAPREGKFAFCADQSGDIWYNENGQVAECLSVRKAIPAEYKEWLDDKP